MLLGVNIDHIAVLREARQINDPNPLDALPVCKFAGADQITIHLREDRRHIHDSDTENIIKLSQLPVNLECSINDEMIDIACKHNPARVTLVPENREEVTTEGGLNITSNLSQIQKAITRLHEHEIEVSLFIDPKMNMVEISKQIGAEWIELHTGSFANIYAMLHGGLEKSHHSIPELELSRAELQEKLDHSLDEIVMSANHAKTIGLKVSAGHGLNYQNVSLITAIESIEELNIGQSIIARSVYSGLDSAIRSMKELVN